MLLQGPRRPANTAVSLLAFLVPSRQPSRPTRSYAGTCLFHTRSSLHRHPCASFLSLKGLDPPAYTCMRCLPAMLLYISRVDVCPFSHIPPHVGPLHYCCNCTKNQPSLVDLPREHFLTVVRSQHFRDAFQGNHLSSLSSVLGQM